MAPDLSEKLLGIDIDESTDQRRPEPEDAAAEDVVLEWFVFFRIGEHRLALSVDEVATITERPDDVTRVPRSPPAIEGVTDLRGSITAVIDPRVQFPAAEERPDREQLVVLDRPTDEQSAAIQVDDVIGVDTVAEPNVLEESDLEDRELSGDALEHPLVVALLEQERESAHDVGSAVDTTDGSEATVGIDSAAGDETTLSSLGSGTDGERSADGRAFELETESEGTTDDGTDGRREVVVEVTPLIDVETLLLSSGHTDDPVR